MLLINYLFNESPLLCNGKKRFLQTVINQEAGLGSAGINKLYLRGL